MLRRVLRTKPWEDQKANLSVVLADFVVYNPPVPHHCTVLVKYYPKWRRKLQVERVMGSHSQLIPSQLFCCKKTTHDAEAGLERSDSNDDICSLLLEILHLFERRLVEIL
jgi:hypothetical protein